MKSLSATRYTGAAVLVLALLSGCATKNGPEQNPAAMEEKRAVAVEPATPVVTQDLSAQPLAKLLPELTNPQSPLSRRSIYFDLDQYTIKDEYKPLVESHATFLKTHLDYRMLIQGNTDERGSREYNLSLGQKRAEALKKALKVLGVNESQLEAVSLGEEKPKNEGHDEAAWSQNRRADMLYRDSVKAVGEF